ncbi:MAG: cell division protein ZapA [Rhodobacteraceae bacterium]|nr:cell division protein ZapA [Paracoccaceae bacterium]MCY4196919.1 cell division protein ZapA [Paracoccaceae bacterium]MCY4326580.1 cell division protein ZapA [Paracoccaceae bacterium]
MHEFKIMAGGRKFTVTSSDSELGAAKKAAVALQAAVHELTPEQQDRLTPANQLLLAAFRLADRSVDLKDEVNKLQSEILALKESLATLRQKNALPDPDAVAALERLANSSEVVAGRLEEIFGDSADAASGKSVT